MIVIFRRLAPVLALGLCVASSWAWADEGDRPDVEAARLAHILGYTAGDYGGAVRGGVVVSETEYEEQRALLTEAAAIAARLGGSNEAPAEDVSGGVGRVRELVEAKASEAEVATAVARVRAAITAAYHLEEAPTKRPDAARGKALFAEHCATCHGVTGHADTERAKSLKPPPANFHDAKVSDPLSPARVASTVRFGIPGTAMVPMSFLSSDDRWSLGFHVMGLRHGAAAADAPPIPLSELATRSDAELEAYLDAAGIAPARRPAMLAALRKTGPYEARPEGPLVLARLELSRAAAAMSRDDLKAARELLIDGYLEGIEPIEAPLRASDPALVDTLEQRFLALRGALEARRPPAVTTPLLHALQGDLTRAELVLAAPDAAKSPVATALSSAGILLREGVEAALLVAALLGIASRLEVQGDEDAKRGRAKRVRWVHAGWASAALLGIATWFGASRIVAISGARRELIEGVTALFAMVVLFYVSYSLLAKREVARWMKFLRGQVTPQRAALSLFGVSFLAVYREAFETVLFYQALLATSADRTAALSGVVGGGAALVALVAVYTQAGKFAPPQAFFRVSSYLLYGLAVVFAGQGVAALQMTGFLPIHPLAVPTVAVLGIHGTLETCAAQTLLIALAVWAFAKRVRDVSPGGPAAPALPIRPEQP